MISNMGYSWELINKISERVVLYIFYKNHGKMGFIPDKTILSKWENHENWKIHQKQSFWLLLKQNSIAVKWYNARPRQYSFRSCLYKFLNLSAQCYCLLCGELLGLLWWLNNLINSAGLEAYLKYSEILINPQFGVIFIFYMSKYSNDRR